MKVILKHPTRVNALSGEVEVTRQEYERLLLLGAVEPETKAVQDESKVVKRKRK
jgi:hypothetical protein